MARIGKCKTGCGGWVTLVAYASVEHCCDGIGYCKKCSTEHRLEMKGKSKLYSIMDDWKLNYDRL